MENFCSEMTMVSWLTDQRRPRIAFYAQHLIQFVDSASHDFIKGLLDNDLIWLNRASTSFL